MTTPFMTTPIHHHRIELASPLVCPHCRQSLPVAQCNTTRSKVESPDGNCGLCCVCGEPVFCQNGVLRSLSAREFCLLPNSLLVPMIKECRTLNATYHPPIDT